MYKVQEKFVVSPLVDKLYWKKDVQYERFRDTLVDGLLYRPNVTNEIYSKVLDLLERQVPAGLMIKGPQGIGKSHSIVNLARKLLSTGSFVVTIVPYCGKWGDTKFLVDSICSSFGAHFEDDQMTSFHLLSFENLLRPSIQF
jgi:hypothetical protein